MNTRHLVVLCSFTVASAICYATTSRLPVEMEAISPDEVYKLRLEVPHFKDMQSYDCFQSQEYAILTAAEGENFAAHAQITLRLSLHHQDGSYVTWWARPDPNTVIPLNLYIIQAALRYAIVLDGKVNMSLTNDKVPFSVFSISGSFITNGTYNGTLLARNGQVKTPSWLINDSKLTLIGTENRILVNVELPKQ